MPRSGKAPALRVVNDFVEPAGDPDARQKLMREWTEGQKECRAKRQHRYKPIAVDVYGKKVKNREDLPVGTRVSVIERCKVCFSVERQADHITTARGVRPLEDWRPHYSEHKDVPYLLPAGSGPLDDGDREELKAHMYLDNAKLRFIDYEDE